ncbi:hypothetical protein Pmani_019653 [Petrolisthes manimaculis]|uniref:Uncharacterized protein n=1 Tax=Petrolisthes manimaculis TaxID=1843537 RepID=A0AAE1PJ66_9EUCA|nr:hypothetical protein Pmani_019653 [Petrolisthes manimaculis]
MIAYSDDVVMNDTFENEYNEIKCIGKIKKIRGPRGRKRGYLSVVESEELELGEKLRGGGGGGGGEVRGGGVVGVGVGEVRGVLRVGASEMPLEDLSVSPASLTDLDSALGGSTASPDSTRKTHSGCSSMSDRDEENFECYGEAEDIECDSDSARMGDDIDGSHLLSPPHSLPPSNFSRRNSWVRRSLRGSPASTQDKVVPPRRWASFRQ